MDEKRKRASHHGGSHGEPRYVVADDAAVQTRGGHGWAVRCRWSPGADLPPLRSRHGAATGRRRELRVPQARRRRRAAPLHAPDPARERPSPGLRRRRRRGLRLGRRRRAFARDRVRAGARPAAGLHGRPVRRRPRGDARRDARPGRRPEGDQPADPGRARDRPLGAGRRVRVAARDRAQRRARVRAEPRALRLPPLGPGRVRQLPRRAAEHRDRPPGQPRVPRARRRGARRRRLPRHARRHRLAHDDGQRPRRARLGRRRDRGRGRDARRGAVDARAAGRRLPAHGRAARGRDGDRPRAHGDRDPAQDRRGREVRRVLRARRRLARPRRPRDAREHEPRVRRDVRLLPRRRGDASGTCA